MSQMKGGEVIAEYLVKQKVPFATASPWFRRATSSAPATWRTRIFG